jgi:hypothetical protein
MREHRRRSSFVFPFALLCAAGASLFTVTEDGAPALRGPREASASVAIAVSLEDLARASSVIARVTPLEATSAWEDGRIITTTRLHVDDVVAGNLPTATRELRVRTLGGRVDTIGQLVEGEASFAPAHASIVFLAPFARSAAPAFVVVGRAQGQLHVKREVHGTEVVRIGAVGELVERRILPPLRAGGQRIVELDGQPLQTVTIEAKRAWEAGHAK